MGGAALYLPTVLPFELQNVLSQEAWDRLLNGKEIETPHLRFRFKLDESKSGLFITYPCTRFFYTGPLYLPSRVFNRSKLYGWIQLIILNPKYIIELMSVYFCCMEINIE